MPTQQDLRPDVRPVVAGPVEPSLPKMRAAGQPPFAWTRSPVDGFRWLRRHLAAYGLALTSVGVVTLVISLLDRPIRIVDNPMLYLIAVLLTATSFGSGPAVCASLASFVAFDWFFVAPRYTLAVADSEEWTALLLFLLTAIVTGQLAAGQRARAREAAQHEREATVLADVIRLLADQSLADAVESVARRLRSEFRLAAVQIELADARGVIRARAQVGDPAAFEDDRPYAVPVFAMGQRGGELRVVPPAGSAGLTAGDGRLLDAIAAQLGAALERARLRHDVTQTEILRSADALKTALLRAVSHDLRTPLASIIAYAGSLRQTDVAWTEAERIEFAGAIEQEARRLNRLVGNLLDMSRMQAGSLVPDKNWYDLGALIDDVLGRLQPLTTRHPIAVDVPETLPPVLLDYVEIDGVLTNLIENAVKYTPPGTDVTISARVVGKSVSIAVADRGPGLSGDELAHLFEPFYRGRLREGGSGGTGIGLAVAKGLVEAHGGQIWAENRPGGGACFRFSLPLGEAR
jgi:two-component system sensor histidine kinase KdpD